jgi:ATP-dependent helicase HrpB
LSFDPTTIDLPITEIIPAVKDLLRDNNTLIINAPAGAGKSTLLPLALFDEPWLEGKQILMLEPRRLATSTIASRMAFLLGEAIGKTVGYQIRFENRTSSATRIKVLTEGILARMLLSDNALEGVGMVIFDEFHERSLFADEALALCREAQSVLRPDLRIVIMSATLDMPKLTELLKAPVAQSMGRQYPVEILYSDPQSEDMQFLPEMVCKTILKAVTEKEGDTLVFLPGESEIRKTEELLKKRLPHFVINPLYGKLPHAKQNQAIIPNKEGKRKIVLATSIAETSLTIENIKIVVDTGYGRTSRFDPNSGLSRLETIRISKDSADQRAGRAGRLTPGTCYRMWSRATHDRLQDHRIPEIQEADLAPMLLDLAEWGAVDVGQLTWLTPPPKGALLQAFDTLQQLDALDNGRITEQGKLINKLPCHPRIAHLLLMAKEQGTLGLATDLAAILEEKDPLPKEAGVDINLRIEALRRQRSRNDVQRTMARIEKIASSYRKMFDIEADNEPYDSSETGLLLVSAYPERIACARPGNNAQYQLSNGSYAMFSHKDDLSVEPWLVVANMDARDGLGKIFLASSLNPKDLAPLVKEQEVVIWDTRKGGLIATRDKRIGGIVLQSKPLPAPDEQYRVKAISDAIQKEGKALLNFDENVSQWQNRIQSLRKWRPQDEWPDVSTITLLLTNKEWLSPYLKTVKTNDDLQKIDLMKILPQILDWEKQKTLDTLAPQTIAVPSGSHIKIQYLANGEQPILAVRLQELFGLAHTPTINEGKTSLIMHLLSPGFKLVQITSDLHSFWNNAYFEVKKELKIKYPKHSWPDDTWTSTPVKGALKKNRIT